MYINKTVFVEEDNTQNLDKFNIIQETDYGTREITNDNVQNRVEEIKENPDEFNYTLEEFEEEMRNSLGEAYDMLLNDELDFVLIVY